MPCRRCPTREGDPEPPPDNGQHIALGCFTEYLRFLERVGEGSSYLRMRLALPVLDTDGTVAAIEPRPGCVAALRHLPLRDRIRIPLVTARCRTARAKPGETFGSLLRRLGTSDAAIDRFWDVFVRPALNLRCDEVDAEAGLFTVRTALARPAREQRPDPADGAARPDARRRGRSRARGRRGDRPRRRPRRFARRS